MAEANMANGFNMQLVLTQDLSGADLHGRDLRAVALRRKLLKNANLRGANMSGVDLSGCDLRGADMRGANLASATLDGADLRLANLSGAIMSHAQLNRVNARGVFAEGADLRSASIQGSHFDSLSAGALAQLDDEGVLPINWYYKTETRGLTNLQHINAICSDWKSTTLFGATLVGAKLSWSVFGLGRRLQPAEHYGRLKYAWYDARGKIPRRSVTPFSPKALVRFPTQLQRTQLAGADLTYCELSGVLLSSKQLAECSVEGAIGYVVL